NMKLVEKFLEVGANMMRFGDDSGNQTSLPMSPEHFRKYLGPCYAKIFGACRKAGAHVYLHTDGHIVEIMEDLIKYGVTILNPEDYPNGLDAIASKCKGKVCVDLTLAQQYFPFLTPEEIFDYFEEVVVKLGAKEGGLMWYVEIDPDVPLENIEAIFQAVEKYRCYYSS
ncbi:MAG: uroporphyrinogen decarboxylase family protein, partial [bacterium]